MNEDEEFYLGWEDKAPSGIRSHVRRVVTVALLFGMASALVLGIGQRTIGSSVFEWGQVKEFSGRFKSQPYPHLLVARPGRSGGLPSSSSYYLVKPFKFGLEPTAAKRLDGQFVTLKGTLIYRGDQTMIEVVEGSLSPVKADARTAEDRESDRLSDLSQRLGRHTFVGEIVDSKCYLGVMNPGALIPHRACAIRCLSGGIPPLLLVRQADGSALHLLLVSPDRSPVNEQVLGLVAEPVQVTGEVERQGELLVLRADPKTIRRVTR